MRYSAGHPTVSISRAAIAGKAPLIADYLKARSTSADSRASVVRWKPLLGALIPRGHHRQIIEYQFLVTNLLVKPQRHRILYQLIGWVSKELAHLVHSSAPNTHIVLSVETLDSNGCSPVKQARRKHVTAPLVR